MSAVLRRDLLFYAGGDALLRYGRFTRVTHPSEDTAEVHTRTGAVGPYTDRGGKLLSAEADTPRPEWLDLDGDGIFETPSLLLEAARTNLVDSDDISAWSVVGTPVVTSGVSDPAGGTGAFTVEDNDGAAEEFPLRAITFTGDAAKSMSFDVRENMMPAAGVQSLRLTDTTASVNRLDLEITGWTDGEPTVSAATGTYLGKRYRGNGYWQLYGRTTSVTAANGHEVRISPARTAAETGKIDIHRVNAFDATDPALSVLDASEALGAETWFADHTPVPQVATFFLDFIEGIGPTWSTAHRLLQVGNAGGTGARFMVRHTSAGADTYVAEHVNADGNSVNATVDVNPAWGDRVRIRAVLNADGSVLIGAMKDSGAGFGAETVSGTSSAPAGGLSSVWADTRLYLSHPAENAIAAFISAKVASGVKTMAEMREILPLAAAA